MSGRFTVQFRIDAKERITEMRARGFSWSEIAFHLGIERDTTRHLLRYVPPPATRSVQMLERQREVQRLRTEHFLFKQIAYIVGISEGHAKRLWRQGTKEQALFRTVTRVTPAGEASVVRDG